MGQGKRGKRWAGQKKVPSKTDFKGRNFMKRDKNTLRGEICGKKETLRNSPGVHTQKENRGVTIQCYP